MSRAAFVLWHLWLAWNDKVFEDKDTDPQDIASKALSLLEEFTRLNYPISSSPPFFFT